MDAVYKKNLKLVSLIWGGSIILALIVNMIVIAPQNQCKEQIRKQFAEKKRTYNAIVKMSQEKTRIRLNKKMEQWREGLKNYVASTEDLAGLTFDIGQIAKDIQIDSFTISHTNNSGNQNNADSQYVSERQMSVNFKASFNQFAAFLNAMERHRPVIFVDKFLINPTDRDNSISQVNMSLSIFVKKRQGG
jgi:hypothetical protein